MQRYIKILLFTLLSFGTTTAARAFDPAKFATLTDAEKLAFCQDNINNQKDMAANAACKKFIFPESKYTRTPLAEQILQLDHGLNSIKEILQKDIDGRSISDAVYTHEYLSGLFKSNKEFINWVKSNTDGNTKIRNLILETPYIDKAAMHYLHALKAQNAKPVEKLQILQKRAVGIAGILAAQNPRNADFKTVKYYYENGDITNFLNQKEADQFSAELFRLAVYADANSKYKSADKADKKAQEILLTPFDEQKKYIQNFFKMPQFTSIPPFANPAELIDANSSFEATSYQTQTILNELKKYLKAEIKDTKTNKRLSSFYASSNYKMLKDPPFSWQISKDIPGGFLMLWNAETYKVEVSMGVLNQWLKDNKLNVKDVLADKNNIKTLAKCMAPLFVHETEHQMYSAYFFGKGWDKLATKEEEVLAFNAQEVFMSEKENTNGLNYYNTCPQLQQFRKEPIDSYVDKVYGNIADPFTVKNVNLYLERYTGPYKDTSLKELITKPVSFIASWYGLSFSALKNIAAGTDADFNFYRAYMDTTMQQFNKIKQELKDNSAADNHKKQQIKEAVKDIKSFK